MKYRKKPVVIEAFKWTGSVYSAGVPNWFLSSDYIKPKLTSVIISTLEGDMEAQPGDYIIKGIKGELYPCKPDIFEQTYEKVEE